MAVRHPEVGTDCPLVDKEVYSNLTRRCVFYCQTECQRWSSKERWFWVAGLFQLVSDIAVALPCFVAPARIHGFRFSTFEEQSVVAYR